MTKTNEIIPTVKGPVGTTRTKSSVLPPKYSWLSLPIPKEVHAHIHHMARLSDMSLKEYVTWFLRTAVARTESGNSNDLPTSVPETIKH